MPLVPSALESLILSALMEKTPDKVLATAPLSTTVSTTTNPDGTTSTTSTPIMGAVYIDEKLAAVIASSVAAAVVKHLSSNYVLVTGTAGPYPVVAQVT